MGDVFVSERDVAFGDVDYAKVLYYPRLFHYCHQALEDFSAGVLGVPYPALVTERNLGFPTVHLEADYREPIRYGDRLHTSMSLIRLGRSSLELRFAIRTRPAGPLCAEARITKVLVDMTTFEKRTIPDWMRERLTPLGE